MREIVYYKIFQNVSYFMSGLSWTFHENQFMPFSVILLIGRQADMQAYKQTEMKTSPLPFGESNQEEAGK